MEDQLQYRSLEETQPLTIARSYFDHSHQQPVGHAQLQEWESEIGRITYVAQLEVHKLNSNSKNAFRLFRSQGIKVTWPNIFEKWSICREQKVQELVRLKAEALEKERSVQQKLLDEHDEHVKNEVILRDGIMRKEIVQLYEQIQALREKHKDEERGDPTVYLRERISEFNTQITLYGQHLGLSYEKEKY